jgi:hypothetical protein
MTGLGVIMHIAHCLAPASMPLSTGHQGASPAPVTARIAAAFRAALDDGVASAELEISTHAFVDMLKADGLPPEKALVALKNTLAGEARCLSLAPLCCASHAPSLVEQRMYRQVFDWYLDAFFR